MVESDTYFNFGLPESSLIVFLLSVLNFICEVAFVCEILKLRTEFPCRTDDLCKELLLKFEIPNDFVQDETWLLIPIKVCRDTTVRLIRSGEAV